MKELLVISGKGGTGKTSLVGSLALLIKNKVLVDCDVDASNLHLLLQAKKEKEVPFYGLNLPVIDQKKCTACKECLHYCPSGAIQEYRVNPLFCEGCLICYHICQEKAISLTQRLSGFWYSSKTPYGPLIHASLGIGQENSGLLVSEVKKEARFLAQKLQVEYLILDGPPGCACPLIASLSGVDLALIVTEPTLSGIHDLKRILQVVKHFGIKASICINKYDLHLQKSQEIEEFALGQGIEKPVLLPFDPLITRAMVKGEPVVLTYPDAPSSKGIRELKERVMAKL